MTILAATDFSPAADNAVRTAIELARKLGDSVLVARIVEPPLAIYPELPLPDSAAFDAALQKANEAELARAIATLACTDVSIEGRILVGPVAQSLVDLAGSSKARFLVMGTTGRGALKRLALGSTAESMVLTSPCPVLVVPEGATPLSAWSAGRRPLRALVGLDLDDAAARVLDIVKTFRQSGSCDLALVHAYWPPAEYHRLGLHGPHSYFDTDPEVVAMLEREIRARTDLPAGPGATSLRIESAWGRVGETLAQDAEREEADLIVVGTRQPHGWNRLSHGSTAIGALRAARIAVLCVPSQATSPTIAARPTIPTLRTVLAATDLSAIGNAAIPHAYSLLRATGGVVELMTVHEGMAAISASYDRSGGLAPRDRQSLEEKLATLIPAEAESLGITTHIQVIDGGKPGDAIAQAARRVEADAIVMGSHGSYGLRRTLLGSIAESVLHNADVPVYVIRPRST